VATLVANAVDPASRDRPRRRRIDPTADLGARLVIGLGDRADEMRGVVARARRSAPAPSPGWYCAARERADAAARGMREGMARPDPEIFGGEISHEARRRDAAAVGDRGVIRNPSRAGTSPTSCR
jgi:hypothetical protein